MSMQNRSASEAKPIGSPVVRRAAQRHLSGKGRFVTDMTVPGMCHAAFVRSPMARAKLLEVEIDDALAAPGVITVLCARDLENLCKPWVGSLSHFEGMKSPSQVPLADSEIIWAGQPIAIVIAETRAQAEDAAELVWVDLEEQDPTVGLDATKPAAAGLEDNLCYEVELKTDGWESAFQDADTVVEADFRFGRHTAVTLEPRAILAQYVAEENQLTVHQGTQTPYQFQDIYAHHFGLLQSNVRVIAPDVGGSFGMKLHVYHEELAVVAASIKLGRPVKYIADRLEAFTSDIHARDHFVRGKMALDKDGKIRAMHVEDETLIGPFSAYPRTSVAEGNQVLRLMGAPYQMSQYHGHLKVHFQNKVQTSQYRAVGHPIACAVTETLVDLAAERLNINPFEIRELNVIPDDDYPNKSATGYQFEALSHQKCLQKLHQLINYKKRVADQSELRKKGVHQGIGIAVFSEITNPGTAFYGIGGARISAQDGAIIKLTPDGQAQCSISVTEQGQGTETIVSQIVAEQLGLSPSEVKVLTGDTETTPSGGATWACRGAGIGGETALRAARKLADQICNIAAAIHQADRSDLHLSAGMVVSANTGQSLCALSEISRVAYYRPDTLPADLDSSLTVAHHFSPTGYPFDFTNGVQASHVEVDVETGIVRLLNHWVVEDCGTIINPLLVDEQIRGGVVQGLGAALFEECLYDDQGQLTNGSLADYLVPMACEMPDIVIAHVETPTNDTILGAKGVGEAGTAAAGAAALNAVNDALRPFQAQITQTPMTPQRILNALGAFAETYGDE